MFLAKAVSVYELPFVLPVRVSVANTLIWNLNGQTVFRQSFTQKKSCVRTLILNKFEMPELKVLGLIWANALLFSWNSFLHVPKIYRNF